MKRYRIIHKTTGVEAPRGEFLIGRAESCHLILEDPSVSRIHAAIVFDGERLLIEDRRSRNGVRVNDKLVKNSLVLQDGDHIKIGHQTIRISSMDKERPADHTVGTKRCPHCGVLLTSNDEFCLRCGSLIDETSVHPVVEYEQQGFLQRSPRADTCLTATSGIHSRPIGMMAGLAVKSARVGKLDEAEKIMNNTMRMVTSRARTDKGPSATEVKVLCEALVELAERSKKTDYISNIFTVHLHTSRLVDRDLVEKLYDLVRVVGYRACRDLTRYIEQLTAQQNTLGPGERFTVRRLEGLVKICS